ncbi:MAG: hypothetical protein ACREJC_05810, partial [Tepidisphaeraceae bacterium]
MPFGELSVRLVPGLEAPTGTYVHTSLDAYEQTLSVTPDGQALGVASSGSPLYLQTLTRTNVAGEVTLSRALSANSSSEDDGVTYDAGFAVAQAEDQGFFVLGETNSFGLPHGQSLWAIRTDQDGRLLWQRKLPGLDRGTDSIPNVLAGSDGFFFGAFNRANGGPVVGKLSLNGDVAWLASLPARSCDPCDIRIAMLPNGDLVAAGTGWTGQEQTPWLARVNGTGSILWMRGFAFSNWSFNDIDVLP